MCKAVPVSSGMAVVMNRLRQPRTVGGACADCTPMNTREGCLKCELAKDTVVDGSASKRHDRAYQRDRDRVAHLRQEVTETWRVSDLAVQDRSFSTLTSDCRLKRFTWFDIARSNEGIPYYIEPISSPRFEQHLRKWMARKRLE